MMTKEELIQYLEKYDDKMIVICSDQDGSWENIDRVETHNGEIAIVYGDEHWKH